MSLGALSLVLSACGTSGEAEAGVETKPSTSVTLVVHDSFPNEAFAEAASKATGYDVNVASAGDGGELTNTIVLSKGAPIADAFYGVDNIFASRLIEHEVINPYTPADLPESAASIGAEFDGTLTAIDQGATCINIDTEWFGEQGIPEPTTYDDLTSETYRDLTVILDPTSSSTGASFLVGTVAAFGESGALDYWQRLVDNGANIVQGWSDAYNGQFTQGGGNGTRPIVLSYSTSPAFTVNDDATKTTTRALLDTCSSQVEFAGVLKDATNPEGAKAVVDYLASPEFQATIADAMYVYPSDDSIELPETWQKFAPLPSAEQLNDLPSSEIEASRERWLRALSDAGTLG